MQHQTLIEKATFGGGCFWCTEAIFQRLKGVDTVISGYSGGHLAQPTYKEVCSENTGHAEVIQISFYPDSISYEILLDVFFATHDPTTLNQQGNDVGAQYRSVIFYHTESQKQVAQNWIKKLSHEKIFDKKIVTEVSPFTSFYAAEPEHQNYYNLNAKQPYCSFVIQPKLAKFEHHFKDIIKP